MRRLRIFLFLVLLTVAGLIAAIYICYKTVQRSSDGKLYSDVRRVPYNKVGLLLGTNKYLAGGGVNTYYRYRIKAAVELVKAGKVKYIIASGNNESPNYNEPQQMKEDLIKEGVDSSRIFLDPAGLRTFDSMVRLREVFGEDSVTVISQKFHNERALYIASREGIYAVGFNARDRNREEGGPVQAREKLARVKVFLDYFMSKDPKYLGKKVKIPE